MTVSRYTHLELNKDVEAPAGYYTPRKEVRLKCGGREVLYAISQAVVECSCCGACNFATALVPGYIVKWHAEKNKAGSPITEKEPLDRKSTRLHSSH